MSFEMPRTHQTAPEPLVDPVTIDRHLYLTEDKTRVVEEGDPAGRWLWAAPGTDVSRREALRLGAIPQPEAAVEPDTDEQPETDSEDEDDEGKPAAKQRRTAANKQRTTHQDK